LILFYAGQNRNFFLKMGLDFLFIGEYILVMVRTADPVSAENIPNDSEVGNSDNTRSQRKITPVILLIALFLLISAIISLVIVVQKNKGSNEKAVTPAKTVGEEGKNLSTPESNSGTSSRIPFLKKSDAELGSFDIWTVGLGEPTPKDSMLGSKKIGYFNQSPNHEYACFLEGDSAVKLEIYLYGVENNTIKQISNSYFAPTPTVDGSGFGYCVWSVDGQYFTYKVDHAPYEFTESGIPKVKEKPLPQDEEKMGVFVYDIKLEKLTKAKTWQEVENTSENNSWLPEGSWTFGSGTDRLTVNDKDFYFETLPNDALTFNLMMEDTKSGDAKTIYTLNNLMGRQPPLTPSQDKSMLVFPNVQGYLVVVPMASPTDYRVLNNARSDGNYSRYDWVSSKEVIFWESRAGHKYTDEGWYYGNIKVVDVDTGKVRNLTADNKAFWQYFY